MGHAFSQSTPSAEMAGASNRRFADNGARRDPSLLRSHDTPGRILVIVRPCPYRASRGHGRSFGTGACWAGLFGVPRARVRGVALSSAILYLAIVAIWAVVLMPRWLRPPHAGPRQMAANHFESADPGERDDLAWADEDDDPAGRWQPADGDTGLAGGEPAPHPEPERDRVADRVHPSPAQRRARVLQARRRTLATLVLLTAGAVGIAVTHLAASWVIIPPTVMLAGFVLLLREAARIDAERERAASMRGGLASDAGTPAEGGMGAEGTYRGAQSGRMGRIRPAEPTAEIIDISDRVGDQLYDQYTDAAVRAVGD